MAKSEESVCISYIFILLHVTHVDDVNRERTTCQEEGEGRMGRIAVDEHE